MIRTLPLLLSLILLTGAGRVQTRDGKTIDGAVALADNAVVVRSEDSRETRVAFDQVSRIWFEHTAAPQAEAGAPLPAGWKSVDLGRVTTPGSAVCDAKGAFALTASGWGAWGAADSFQFAYRTLDGDGQVFARVAKLDDAQGPVVAGVMMRESLAPDAPMAASCLYGTGEVRMTRRPVTGALKEFKLTDADPKASAWVRLTRRGEDVIAFRSSDGRFWQRVDQGKVPMGKSVLVGVCAWTTGNAWVGGAQVDSFHVVPGTPGLSYFAGGDPLVQGLLLRDGNRIAGTIISGDKAGVRYEREGKSHAIAIEQVARLIFSPVPPDLATPGRAGVLLANGDFVDGEVADVSVQPVDWPRPPQLKVAVRSVLFGTRTFEVAREVVLLDFAEVTPVPAAYEVRTADGSVARAKKVVLGKDGVTVDGALLKDIVEIRKL